MRTEVIGGDDVVRIANDIIVATEDALAIIVIGGERSVVCDEAIVFADDALIGMATIAQKGESGSGEPTIVGVYVRPADRKRGYGTLLLEAAVRRCRERGFERVRIDTLTKGGKKIVRKLSPELLAHIDLHDQSDFLPSF